MTVKHKLGRNAAHRWAMLRLASIHVNTPSVSKHGWLVLCLTRRFCAAARTMVTQLLQHERIQTTLPKAKELRKVADRVITYAKKVRHWRGLPCYATSCSATANDMGKSALFSTTGHSADITLMLLNAITTTDSCRRSWQPVFLCTLAAAFDAIKRYPCMLQADKNGLILAGSIVRTERELHKLMTTMAERYKDRQGGYTRIVQLGRRQHDAAQLAYIE